MVVLMAADIGNILHPDNSALSWNDVSGLAGHYAMPPEVVLASISGNSVTPPLYFCPPAWKAKR